MNDRHRPEAPLFYAAYVIERGALSDGEARTVAGYSRLAFL